MLNIKKMVCLIIPCVFAVQILTSTVFINIGLSYVQAASSDGTLIENNESALIGDVDGNGQINSIDFARMRMYLLGKIKNFPISNGTWAADVSGDGIFNSIDFGFMRKYMLGYIKKFPAEENDITPTPSVSVTPSPTVVSPSSKPEGLVSDMEDLKIALIQNFNEKGTNFSLTYEGDITDMQTKVNQALSEAIDESNEPFMLQDVSYSMGGYSGNLQIIFEFVYDEENEYIAVARSTEELKKALLREFYNRTEDINVIYKGTIAQSEIDSAREWALNYDTYMKVCISSCEGIVVSNKSLGINAIRINCSYKTTLEQEKYIDERAVFIVSKLTNMDMDEDEKEKLIHDYILTNVDYTEEEKYGDAYSALYYGKTKCDGYAMLTYKMLKAASIESKIVTNEDHAWNVVKINEKWYHLDTTWDDGKKESFGFYKYYNLTDDEILETRNYENVYGIECTSNYMDDLSERNIDGKYDEILKDLDKRDNYYLINSFDINNG